MKTEISVESKHQTLQGLAFPLQPEAQRALQQLKQKMVNYIQLVGACSLPWHTLLQPLLLPVHMCWCAWSAHPISLQPVPFSSSMCSREHMVHPTPP